MNIRWWSQNWQWIGARRANECQAGEDSFSDPFFIGRQRVDGTPRGGVEKRPEKLRALDMNE